MKRRRTKKKKEVKAPYLLFLNPFIDFTADGKKKYKEIEKFRSFKAFCVSLQQKTNPLLIQTGKAAGLKVVTLGKKNPLRTDRYHPLKNVSCPKANGYAHLDQSETRCINFNTIKINKS